MSLAEEFRESAQQRLEEIERNRELYDQSYETYARDALMVRPREGGDKLFKFNSVQQDLDTRLDNQRTDPSRQRVRALVLKARKVGISTYMAGRFYHRVVRNRGLQALIMTHRERRHDEHLWHRQAVHGVGPALARHRAR